MSQVAEKILSEIYPDCIYFAPHWRAANREHRAAIDAAWDARMTQKRQQLNESEES